METTLTLTVHVAPLVLGAVQAVHLVVHAAGAAAWDTEAVPRAVVVVKRGRARRLRRAIAPIKAVPIPTLDPGPEPIRGIQTILLLQKPIS